MSGIEYEVADACQIAAYFVGLSSNLGGSDSSYSGNDDLTNLKTQKLLYFAQVEYIKKYNKKLFANAIEAWQYGPVVRSVYDLLKQCGAYLITDFDLDLRNFEKPSKKAMDFLNEFWEKYSVYSAWGLVRKTHEAGSPWSVVYKNGEGDKLEIPYELLKKAETL